MKIVINGFIFSTDDDAIDNCVINSLKEPRRRGMSGCEYGSQYGPVQEAWHITASGTVSINLPLLEGKDEDEGTTIPPKGLSIITTPAIAAGMLMQIREFIIETNIEKIATNSPLGAGYSLYMVYTSYLSKNIGWLFGHTCTYIRPKWPEKPYIEWAGFKIPVPRVGYHQVRLHIDGIYNIARVEVGSIRVYLAQPEGRGKMYFLAHEKTPYIEGGEITLGIQQPNCRIGRHDNERDYIHMLVYNRLGDLFVVEKEVAEEMGLQLADNLGKATIITDNEKEIALIHPEHGLLRVEKEEKIGREAQYGIYKVPYWEQPTD